MTAFANVDGETLLQSTLHIPNVGPWWSDVVFESAPDFAGGQSVLLAMGELSLRGTIDPANNGVFGQQRRSRVLAGGGGWGSPVAAKFYHNDAGVLARTIAEDAARSVGETIGAFAASEARAGIDYTRQTGAAARVLEDVIGDAVWWVDADGFTVVGTRATQAADPAAYEVLEYDPREGIATLAVDDLSQIGIGSVFSVGLEAPLTAFEIEAIVDTDRARVVVWGGGTASRRGRLADLLESIVEAVTRRTLFGKFLYRVVQMSAERVELQAVNARAGLPDMLPISQRPGVAGAHASLVGGSIVCVEFIEGDRTNPVVTAYAGKGAGDAPDELDLSVVTTLRLGSDAATEGVTLGDSHKSWADGHTHLPGSFATVSGPVTGVSGAPVTAAPAPSSKVLVE